jgi:hypothetical protein
MGNHSFWTETRGSATVAINTGTPKYLGSLFRFEQTARLRGDPENPDSYLQAPIPPLMDEDGRLFVVDRDAHRIAVFDASGSYLTSIGREGDGPGDLRTPSRIRMENGLLHVSSRAYPPRLTRFRTDGSVVDVRTAQAPIFGPIPSYLDMTPDGTGLLITGTLEAENGDGFMTMAITTLSQDGDTLGVVSTPRVTIHRLVEADIMGLRQHAFDIQFAPYPQILFLSPDQIVTASGQADEIRYHDLRGRLTRTVRTGIPAARVTEADRQRALQLLDEAVQLTEAEPAGPRADLTAAFARARREHPFFAEPKARWDRMHVDDRGYLWLRAPSPTAYSGLENQAHHYYLISPQGENLGSCTWPAVTEGRVQRGHLLAIITDADTGDRIPTVYRIEPDLPGLKYP